MSTRAIVARPLPAGGWEGHPIHSEGHPTVLGRKLHAAIEHFGSAETMREFFCQTHTGLLQFGDPTDLRTDDQARPEYGTDAYLRYAASTICTCCGSQGSRDEPYRHTDIGEPDGPWDIEYLYVLADDGLRVHTGHPTFEHVGAAPWGQPVSDTQWQVLECGERFERCGHYAWVHFPDLPDDCRELSAKTYLGLRPFTHRDAIAAVIDGERVTLRRSGMRERVEGRAGQYGHRWLGMIEHADGRTEDVPLWYVSGPKAGQWIEGVQPIYPEIEQRIPSWWKPPQASLLTA